MTRAAAAPARWDARPSPEVATDRILDAAGRCFARVGIRASSIGDIADEAGCSRPTVYRYFEHRDAVRVAFIRREAARLGGRIRREVRADGPPSRWIVDAVMAAVRGVRETPMLAAWFVPDEVGATLATAMGPDLIADLAGALLDPATHPSPLPTDAAAWTVRIVFSLLATPGPDEATERALLERFLLPALAPADASRA